MTGDFSGPWQPHPPAAANSGGSPLDIQRAAVNQLTNVFVARVMAAQGPAFRTAMVQARSHGDSDTIDLPFLGPGFSITYFSDQIGWQFPAGRNGGMFLLYGPAHFWLYAQFIVGHPVQALLGAESEQPPRVVAEFEALRADVHRRLGGYLAYYQIPLLQGDMT
jgi:hypothetical protein